MKDLCDDAYNITGAINNCPRDPFPRYKVKCRVQVEACVWLVVCPRLGGTMFKGLKARIQSAAFSASLNDVCNINHRQWAFVCCGYYCY